MKNLRSRFAIAGISLSLGLFGCIGQPAITFDSTEYDFGDIRPPVTLTHVFTFRNTGGGILRIESIKPG